MPNPHEEIRNKLLAMGVDPDSIPAHMFKDFEDFDDTYIEGFDVGPKVDPENFFEDLEHKLEEAEDIINDRTRSVLEELGEYLKPKLEENTPKSSGDLARSTKYRIVEEKGPEGKFLNLELIQDAERRFQGVPYHYWLTLHHGLKPAGRLSRIVPGGQHNTEKLEEWVERTLFPSGPKDAKKKLRAVQAKIWREGIEPNDYIELTYRQNRDRIIATQERLGQEILTELFDLPSI